MRKYTKGQKKRTKIGFLAAFYLLLFVFIISFVILGIQSAFLSNELLSIERKKDLLLKENQKLEEQIVEMSSIAKIEETAQSLGFVKPQKVIYIKETQIVAKVF